MAARLTTISNPGIAGIPAVAEMQGLYGAFSFPERLLQKIWARGDFDLQSARCRDGRAVVVIYPGKWNHLGGPDFTGARLRIGGEEVCGDVELHLHAKDWGAHGHAKDPAYNQVVLHVVLFPGDELQTTGAGGRLIPVLGLLPLLHSGLEEYAAEDAVEALAGRPLHQAQEILGALKPAELDALILSEAVKRWRSKIHYARERIARLGWESACHHAALEILGYRFNRAAMLTVASGFPLADWSARRIELDKVYASASGRWVLQGVRPANHPKRRLRQYADWCAARPDWPDRLAGSPVLASLSGSVTVLPAREWRRANRFTAVRRQVGDDLCGGGVGGTRLDNLCADGFLPLLAARHGGDLETAWMAWPAGDAPEAFVRVLRILGVFDGKTRPIAQGGVQGLLGWLVSREALARG